MENLDLVESILEDCTFSLVIIPNYVSRPYNFILEHVLVDASLDVAYADSVLELFGPMILLLLVLILTDMVP